MKEWIKVQNIASSNLIMHHLKLQIPFMPGSGNGSSWGLENPKHFPWNPG